ncbi:hypothetical protein [Nocardia sp. NPDC004860]|uniref:hypothetical protein n=1 Tax=Nocardia sp. NPDC004860 TaxID=3154557 RepID=UPI00339DC3A5
MSDQSERRAIAQQLEQARNEAMSAAMDLGKWCGNGDYATILSEHARDAAGLRALAGLEAVIGDLTAVFERLAAAVADAGDFEHAH